MLAAERARRPQGACFAAARDCLGAAGEARGRTRPKPISEHSGGLLSPRRRWRQVIWTPASAMCCVPRPRSRSCLMRLAGHEHAASTISLQYCVRPAGKCLLISSAGANAQVARVQVGANPKIGLNQGSSLLWRRMQSVRAVYASGPSRARKANLLTRAGGSSSPRQALHLHCAFVCCSHSVKSARALPCGRDCVTRPGEGAGPAGRTGRPIGAPDKRND